MPLALKNLCWTILASIGIHSLSPIKEAWLVLLLLVTALSVDLLRKLRAAEHSALWVYLFIFVLDPLKYTKWWSTAAEIIVAASILLLPVEAIYLLGHSIKFTAERHYRRIMCFGLTVFLVSFGTHPPPAPYQDFNKLWFYLRLYSTLTTGAALAGIVVYNWWAIEWKHFPASIPWVAASVWCGAMVWAGLQPRSRWYQVGIVRLSIQLGCLAVWHRTLPNRRHREDQSLAPQPDLTFGKDRVGHPRSASPNCRVFR